ncbi:tetratricopeptide (TPR) repeat protein [Hamadaea flava]|uniref:AfsR family transcriptional regulator n=1 Tax=Hamadaea flava TaxID=1742688 RepID=A0ABV8LLS5_9ACTN|nr:AfsR family transcriptional regulator [Hamadaea flava]MCP2324152.1 tetratricopeptide (TPR) repeat protein [Hamadaea flava]
MGVTPVPVGEALTRLLRALEVNPRTMDYDLGKRSSQLRMLLRERRCLLVLDDAGDEAQVRQLLPDTGAGMVIVTSRRSLGGLEGIIRIGLPPLSEAESEGLLEAIAGSAPEAELSAVAAMCGNLPLALRIAGTRLASRPGWTMGHLAQRLADADRRLANLATGDVSLAAAFGLSYNRLHQQGKTIFRRLAHVPGPDFAVPIAAVLTATGSTLSDEDVYAAEDLLDELVDLGLLLADGADGFRFHDLLRLFAADRLRHEELVDTRTSTEHRMHDWLLETAIVAGRWFEPGFGAPPKTWRGLVSLDTEEHANAWLQAESDNWFAAFRAAAAAGRDQLVVDVAEAMHWDSDRSIDWPHWPEIYYSSRAAAARLPDRRQEITHLNYASWAASVCERRHAEGAALAMQAYHLADELGDLTEQANAMYYVAVAWRGAGEYAEAVPAYRRAQELCDAADNHDMYVQSCTGGAIALRRSGQTEEAIDAFHLVLRAIDERPLAPAPARVAKVVALANMIAALADAGRWRETVELAVVSLPESEEFGALSLIGLVHIALGKAHGAVEAVDLARDHLRRALRLCEEGWSHAESITEAQRVLADLDAR